jgi:hypothetical protein
MWRGGGGVPTTDDLDSLQVVTRREFRRGYQAQVDGELTRLRYRKIMTAADGHVLVCRPRIGEERRKHVFRGLPRALGIFLAVAWPITLLVILAVIALVVSVLRHLF